MKKILIIIPLIFSLGLIGCTGNDESNKQEKETSKVEERTYFTRNKISFKGYVYIYKWKQR